MNNKMIHMVTFSLLVAGGLNWLLVGLFDYNLVYMLLGGISPMLVKAVYILVGLSAVYEVMNHKTNCAACTTETSNM